MNPQKSGSGRRLQKEPEPSESAERTWLTSHLPIAEWLPRYSRDDLVGDLTGGIVVAIMLVPQGMAYAMLAGLPPQVGLYASILPLLLYAPLGSSRTLAVGPVAMVSLITASALAPLADGAAADYLNLALCLALFAGLLQIAMGIARLGVLVNFLSHPVISGFTSAAALVIGLSQVKHLLGIDVGRPKRPYHIVAAIAYGLHGTNLATLAVGGGSIAVLLFFQHGIRALLKRSGLTESFATVVAKSGPLVAVVAATVLIGTQGLHESAHIHVVGLKTGWSIADRRDEYIPSPEESEKPELVTAS